MRIELLGIFLTEEEAKIAKDFILANSEKISLRGERPTQESLKVEEMEFGELAPWIYWELT